MSLEGLSETEIQELEQKLLSKIPQNGQSVGNVSVVKLLGWKDETTYWSIRDRLVDRGVLALGRGKGGSLRRIVTEEISVKLNVPTAEISPTTQEIQERITEQSLYKPVAKVLEDEWAKDNRYGSWLVEIIANQGARPTGGRWTRPDIVVASTTTYLYIPDKYFDITTFEVKTHDTMDITAIYEALAHLRSATRAYLFLFVPDRLPDKQDKDELVAQICDEARRHGVGVIVASDAKDYAKWDIRVEAIRQEPTPERLNEFIAQQVSQGFKETLLRWWR